jgi:hypothetical protein
MTPENPENNIKNQAPQDRAMGPSSQTEGFLQRGKRQTPWTIIGFRSLIT